MFSVLLRRAREERDLTLEQLGALVGVTHQAVQAWESGKSKPAPHRWEKIARALGKPPTYFRNAAAVIYTPPDPVRAASGIDSVSAAVLLNSLPAVVVALAGRLFAADMLAPNERHEALRAIERREFATWVVTAARPSTTVAAADAALTVMRDLQTMALDYGAALDTLARWSRLAYREATPVERDSHRWADHIPPAES